MLLVTAQLFHEKKPFLCQFGLLRCPETSTCPAANPNARVMCFRDRTVPSRTDLEESGTPHLRSVPSPR